MEEKDPGDATLFDDVYSGFRFEIGKVIGSSGLDALIYQV